MNKKVGILIFIVLAVAAFGAWWVLTDTPIAAAYKRLFAAVKSKNTEDIKKNMSKTTLEFAESMAQTRNITIDEMLKNGFTETTMSDKMPQFRDERVKDDMGAIEVQNPKGQWEDLPFVKEDGAWKLAIGDIFKATYKLPAPPASAKDRPKMESIPVTPNNMNANMMPMPPVKNAPNNAPNNTPSNNANAGTKKTLEPKPERK